MAPDSPQLALNLQAAIITRAGNAVLLLRLALDFQVSVEKRMAMARALMFDTLKYSKRLVEAGFTESQAEALA